MKQDGFFHNERKLKIGYWYWIENVAAISITFLFVIRILPNLELTSKEQAGHIEYSRFAMVAFFVAPSAFVILGNRVFRFIGWAFLLLFFYAALT